MTGIENHHKRNAPVSLSNDLGLIGAVLQGLVALVVMLIAGIWWALKNYKNHSVKSGSIVNYWKITKGIYNNAIALITNSLKYKISI